MQDKYCCSTRRVTFQLHGNPVLPFCRICVEEEAEKEALEQLEQEEIMEI
jgi:hypothetical protein